MMTRWDILWLAISVALTTATQLRVGGGVVGPGEAMLAIWILIAIARVLATKHHLVSPVVKAVLLFWIACYTALAMGLVMANLQGITASEADVKHNVQALVLASVFSLVFVISFTSIRQAKQGIIYFTTFITISLGILFLFPTILPLVDSSYDSVRFTGWSLNPNQTALSLVFVPFFTIYLFKENSSLLGRIWYGLLTAIAVFLGRSTQSDALNFGWSIGIIFLLVLVIDKLILSFFLNNYYSSNHQRIYRVLARLILFMVALTSLPILFYGVSSTAVEVYDDGGQGSSRLKLWMNGLVAFSRSPVFGLGPGSHSGGIAPFSGMECHNTFIDWATNTGLVGLISYVILLSWIAWITWRKDLLILLSGLIASVGFVSFHYVSRQPIYWFCLLIIAEVALLSPEKWPSLTQKVKPDGKAQRVTLAYSVITKRCST